jgi:predicted RNase H-like HicB family nuclease
MLFVYPAVFHKVKSGCYEGYFPDLSGCRVSGTTLDDAVGHAHDAAYEWISLELTEDEPMLPPISEERDIVLKKNEVIRNISVNIRMFEGWDE